MRAWAGVVLAGLVLSGCGTAVAATGSMGPQTATGPRPGSRAEALAYGRHLLSLAILPPGTHLASNGQHVPAEATGPVAGPDLIQLSKPLVAAGTPAQVRAYVLAHAPQGWDKGWGQTGGPGGPIELDAFFQRATPREGLYFAQLEATIAPAASNTSLVNETADVIWFQPRSPAENLLNPAGYRSVTITADVVYPRVRKVSRTFGGLTATRLLMFLDGQQAAPDVRVSCPLRGADFTLDFRQANPRTPAIRVATSGCPADTIWISGVRQPAVWDTGTLYGMASRLLGLPG